MKYTENVRAYEDVNRDEEPDLVSKLIKPAPTYLVQIRDREGIRGEIMTADKIISRIDMSDIYEEELRIFDISRFGCIEELSVNGCWSDPENPLYIWCTDTKGKVVIDGYGTDH